MPSHSRSASQPRRAAGDVLDPSGSEEPAAEVGSWSAGVPVVGIGASAGGLETLQELLSALPSDTGMAFVVILHLDPDHQSLISELLARCTGMSVAQVNEDTPIEADHVYVIGPRQLLLMKGGALTPLPRSEARGPRTEIDTFFRSLAEECKERAICVVLSGTGSDGTLGLKAVKEHGGVALVQDPLTAGYDGMPTSAIATGLADFVMTPSSMPEAMITFARHPYLRGEAQIGATAERATDLVISILALLHAQTRYDFRGYKTTTLVRRIERRMSLCRVDNGDEYLELLRRSPDELRQLLKDLLIGVTRFFREPEAFKVLEDQVPRLVAGLGEPSLRAWVPGCSTGEEAYSIAMLLSEALDGARKSWRLQVFATDVDDDALDVARAGVYPETIASDVSVERLERFFSHDGGCYQVGTRLRDSVTFATQNLISDPPFSKLDLVSCRNVLIYLKPETQQRILSLLHFSLNDDGLLMLGNAESIGQAEQELFQTVSKRWRVYRRLERPGRGFVGFPISSASARTLRIAGDPPEPPTVDDLGILARNILLREYSPAAVLLSSRFEVLHFHGGTGRYLDLPAGAPTYDVVSMAREGLRTKLRAALHKARRENREVAVADARVKRDGTYHRVRFRVLPATSASRTARMLMVIFEDEEGAGSDVAQEPGAGEESLVRQLELELQTAREDLRNTLAEMDASNEELKATYEEAMSANEELQSTNEELETSKEELQSLNEELTTVNSQLREKVEELESTTDDLKNLLSSTDIATLFLDCELRIRRFTPSIRKLLNLIPSDVGRPISDISGTIGGADLIADAEAVLKQLISTEREALSADGQWYLRRTAPYRTQTNRIAGVVITFSNVTSLKLAEQSLRTITENTGTSFYELKRDGTILFATRPVGGASGNQVVGTRLSSWFPDSLRERIDGLIDTAFVSGETQSAELPVSDDPAKTGTLATQVTPIQLASHVHSAVLTATDITDLKAAKERVEASLKEKEVMLREIHHRVKNNLQIIDSLLSMQAHGTSNVEAANALRDSAARVRNMALIHEKIYCAPDLGGVHFREFLRCLLEELVAMYKNDSGQVTLRTEIDEIVLGVDQAVPCGQIVTELVSNSLKHGFPDGRTGTLLVIMRLTGDGRVDLRVADDGAGLPVGIDTASPQTLGLELVKSLAAQLEGELRTDCSDGVTTRLVFPLARE